MADILVSSPAGAQSRATSHRRTPIDRYTYGITAVLFLMVVSVGFGRTYYLRPLFTTSALPSLLVHLHGVVMSAWVVLFATQVSLIAARRVRLHQRLGYAGIGLAVLIAIIGVWTALRAAKYGTPSTPPGFTQPGFLIVPLGDIVLFALFFGGAVYYRRQPATHKRLMLLTVLNFLPPAVGRLPFATVQASPVAWLLGVIVGAIVWTLASDLWRYRRVNWPFLAGAILLVVSFPVRIALVTTPAWISMAAWLASFV